MELPDEWIARAEAKRSAGDLDGAYADYAHAWSISTWDQSPRQADAAYAAGLMMAAAGRAEEASDAFGEVLSIGDKNWCEAHFHRAVLLRDTDVDPWSHLGPDDTFRPDRREEMLSGFRMGLRSDDAGVVAAARRALEDLGAEVPLPSAHQVARTDPEAAAEIFGGELEDPDPATARNAAWQLHAIRRHQGRYEESAELARRAIALDPPDAATSGRFQRLAEVLHAAGLPEQARVAVDAALAEGNLVHVTSAWRLRAEVLEALGDEAGARESRDRASALEDGFAPPAPEVTLPSLAAYALTSPEVPRILEATRRPGPAPRRGLFRRRG